MTREKSAETDIVVEPSITVPSVVICNVYPDDNRGGAAITSATIAVASRAVPGARLTLITTESCHDGFRRTHRHTLQAHPHAELLPMAVPLREQRGAGLRALLRSVVMLATGRVGRDRALQRVREAQVVIGKGGQVFSLRSGLGALAGLWLAVFPLLMAHRLDTPTVLYGVTIGPYPRRRHHKVRWLVAWILRRIDLIIVRDAESRRQVLELGVPRHRVHELGDAAFGLESPPTAMTDSLLTRYGLSGCSYAALTVTAPAQGELERLIPMLDETLRSFLDDGTIDRVIVVVQTDGPTTSDLADSRRFVEVFDDPRITLIDDDLSPDELIALYGGALFLIGCRLHSAIFGLVGGTLAFPVSRQYMRKADDIYGFVGLGHLVLSVDGSPNEWVTAIRRGLGDADSVRRSTAAAVERLRSDAQTAARLIAELVRTAG